MSKEWKPQSPDILKKEIARLVHFSAKTINSNAAAVGIRLAPDAALSDDLDLPYVSMRTLLKSGVNFRLDYAEGGAATAGIVKHINWVLSAAPEAAAATSCEKHSIIAAVQAANATGYQSGTEHVDHRLRQILIPNSAVEGGYVSFTPMTASSLCAYLFDGEQGLVNQHNAAVKAQPALPHKHLRQAQFGIGGANPQNVGSLVRTMQKPLLLNAPRRSSYMRNAYRLYYKALTFDVHSAGPFRDAVLRYTDFRKTVLLNEQHSSMHNRVREEHLIRHIAAIVLTMAAEVGDILREYAHSLPQETWLPQATPPRYALVSARHCKEIQGLIDSERRSLCENWPRAMARYLTVAMTQAHPVKHERLLLLDATARAHVEGIFEEALR